MIKPIAMQTWGIFVDSYRQLNASRMFWIVLVISVAVVAAFAGVDIRENGLWLFGFTVESDFFNTGIFPRALFWKSLIYINIGVGLWLTWAATILALISTASLIPDFVSGGAIELTLSRPIGRLRLFLTKYLSAMLFVALQVSAFSLACFLLLAVKINEADFRVFLAVPIVVLFFSYLYCITALTGLVTRSAMASILVTLLFWFLLFGVNTTEQVLLGQRIQAEMFVETADERIEQLGGEHDPDPGLALRETISARDELRENEQTWRRWHRRFFAVKTALPKTQETIGLLERALVDEKDRDQSIQNSPMIGPAPSRNGITINPREHVARVQQTLLDRPVWWVIGTSLLFQAAVLALASLVFCRRNF